MSKKTGSDSLIVAVALFWHWPSAVQEEVFDSIAVLPLENRSGDPELEYLSDGITQGIINRLYQLPSLEKVISWSSVRRYKGKEIDTQTLAEELGVRAILLADMTPVGEKMAVNAEMVNARDGSIIWGERFSRASSGVFEMEEYFAGAIAGALGVKVTPEERTRLTKRPIASI